MSKSKYPSQYDSSAEIPVIRDSISPDVINTLRSAIMQIEQTLGINPHGVVGKTLAERLNKVLDSYGNLKKDALTQANILSGPIRNEDVAKDAGISESKLDLHIGTTLLQNEIVSLQKEFNISQEMINEINSMLLVHISPYATGRHTAASISVAKTTLVPSNEALSEITGDNLQEEIEYIYTKHVLYSGEDIAEDNASHTASQVYFNPENSSDLTSAQDMQTALDDAFAATHTSSKEHQKLFHFNGIHKFSALDDDILVEGQEISFSHNMGSAQKTCEITFQTAFDDSANAVEISDIVELLDTGNTVSLVNGDYPILAISRDEDGFVETLTVLGLLTEDSNASTLALIKKKSMFRTSSTLLTTAIQFADLTAAHTLYVSHPNAPKITSSGILPSGILSTHKNLKLKIDGVAQEFNLYTIGAENQTLDTIIEKFNEVCADHALSVLAYREDSKAGSEMSILHNLPPMENYIPSLEVVASTDGAEDVLGFSTLLNHEIFGKTGSSYTIDNQTQTALVEKINSLKLAYFKSFRVVTSTDTSVDFLKLGIKKFDILHIIHAGSTNDNGSYLIDSVTPTSIGLSKAQLSGGFTAASSADTQFIIYENTASLSNVVFNSINATYGSSIFDAYLSPTRIPFLFGTIEYETILSGTDSLFEIVDYEGEPSNFTETLHLEISNSNLIIYLDPYYKKTILGTNSYVWLKSSEGDIRYRVFIRDSDAVKSYIDAHDSISKTIYVFQAPSRYENTHLSRFLFANYRGEIIGGNTNSANINRTTSVGTLDIENLSDSAIQILKEEPLFETRNNGIISGFIIASPAVNDAGFYTFSISHGIAYVKGKRFSISAKEIETDILSTSDTIYVFLDERGNISFEASIGDACLSPVAESEVALIAMFEYDGITVRSIDLRLFLSDLDLKLLNSISVSPVVGMGHFVTLPAAIAYAKRFSKIYPNAGTPIIQLKSGIHLIELELDSSDTTIAVWLTNWNSGEAATRNAYYDAFYDAGLVIDFPVSIFGEGDSSILKIVHQHTFSDISGTATGALLILGDGFAAGNRPNTTLSTGFFSIKNCKLDKTRIEIIDFNILDSDLDSKFCGIHIEDVFFDFQDVASYTSPIAQYYTLHRAISYIEESDTTSKKGNLFVSQSKFFDCTIHSGNLATLSVSNMYNLTFSNNALYGEAATVFFDSDLFTFDSVDETHNIEIIGNQQFSNFNKLDSGGAAGPIITFTEERWGDRLNRDLNVGGTIKAQGNVSAEGRLTGSALLISGITVIGGATTAESFGYPETKSLKQLYLFDRVSVVNVGPSTASLTSAALSTETIAGGGIWRRASAPTSGDPVYVRIDPPDGASIHEIQIGVSRGVTSSDHRVWTLNIHKVPLHGGTTSVVYGPIAVTSTETTGKPYLATFSSIVTTCVEDNAYFIQIVHDQAAPEYVYYIKVIYHITNFETALGI